MLPNKRASIFLFACLLILGGCSGNNLKNAFAPDPKLQENQPLTSTAPQTNQSQLPDGFPQEIPLYPEAQLLSVEPDSSAQQGKVEWQSPNPSNDIENFYQDAFQTNGWNVEPSQADTNELVARKDDLQVTVSVSAANTDDSGTTEFAIAYEQANTAQSGANNLDTQQTQIASSSPQQFSDIDQAPEQLRQPIQELAALGVLTPNNSDQFSPNEPIKRRDFARWLVAANNRLYINDSGKQIRLAAETDDPAFSDIKPTDPDFAVIQGLAQAGIIPSPLTGDSSAVLFRPDAPLTRADLIAWKVPLDTRKALPAASIDAVKETWGFQDTAKIDPDALPALYADYQNKDLSNVSRAFGYTTLFQPNKPVTRAEAAAVLEYFGEQGDRISAKEASQLKEQN